MARIVPPENPYTREASRRAWQHGYRAYFATPYMLRFAQTRDERADAYTQADSYTAFCRGWDMADDEWRRWTAERNAEV